ncbi:hypothetical protein EHQ86_18590 [Leptospira yasudae]|nr:hypothetical protein EHQ86_18590 [Leptospira yasudae]
MKIQEIINTLLLLEDTIEYLPIRNDLANIRCFKDYFLSRCFEKVATVSISFVKHFTFEKKVKLTEIKEAIARSEILSNCADESSIVTLSFLLRNLIEIYVDLRLIEIEPDIELACKELIWHTYIEERRRILDNSKTFYKKEPPSFSKYKDETKEYYKKSTKSNYNQNFKIKLSKVFELADHLEVRTLGTDYFNLYSFLSKKSHFSYTNILTKSTNQDVYSVWIVLLFGKICIKMFELLKSPNLAISSLPEIITKLEREFVGEGDLAIKIGSYVRTEFGFGVTSNIQNLGSEQKLIEFRYLHSIFLGEGFQDVVPAPLVNIITEEMIDDLFVKHKAPTSVPMRNLELLLSNLDDVSKENLINDIYWLPIVNCYGK